MLCPTCPEAGADEPAKWRPEYVFRREWQLSRIDLPNLERLYTLITGQQKDRALWHTLFVVSSTYYWAHSSSAANVIRAYDCATGQVDAGDFRQVLVRRRRNSRYLVPNSRSPASPSPGRM